MKRVPEDKNRAPIPIAQSPARILQKICFFALIILGLFGSYYEANRLKAIETDFQTFMGYFISILTVVGMLIYMVIVLYLGLFAGGFAGQTNSGFLSAPLVFVGVPVAAVASLALVTLLPLTTSSSEPLKLKGLSVEVEGPAAQIILWVMCFIAIIAGIVAAAAIGPKGHNQPKRD